MCLQAAGQAEGSAVIAFLGTDSSKGMGMIASQMQYVPTDSCSPVCSAKR